MDALKVGGVVVVFHVGCVQCVQGGVDEGLWGVGVFENAQCAVQCLVVVVAPQGLFGDDDGHEDVFAIRG